MVFLKVQARVSSKKMDFSSLFGAQEGRPSKEKKWIQKALNFANFLGQLVWVVGTLTLGPILANPSLKLCQIMFLPSKCFKCLISTLKLSHKVSNTIKKIFGPNAYSEIKWYHFKEMLQFMSKAMQCNARKCYNLFSLRAMQVI